MGPRVVAKMARKWLILFVFFLLLFPQGIFAHALLERANPAPDSNLSSSPSAITLTFNERLERELYSIQVIDSHGHSVTENPTEMSLDQKELHLPLPALGDGIYTVTYQVLSADGHPIRGSYVITVGKALPTEKAERAEHVHGKQSSFAQIGFFVVRILYYLTLLLITGWIAWGIFLSFESKELRQSFQGWTRYLQTAYLVALLVMIFVQLGTLLTEWGLHDIVLLLLQTSTGISLTLSLLLSLSGFFVLRRNNWLDGIWVILLLSAKSISGHAMAFEPPIRTILLDMLHVMAASLWTGGLCYLLVFWKRQREAVMRFLPAFSKAALASMIALTITGTLSTLIFLPNLSYIFATTWGLLLLAKGFLVCLVVIVGAILRHGIKKKSIEQITIGLKLDVGLMALIVAIVGVFTYLSPLPQNRPLYWHEMGTATSMITTQITPNTPGINHFSVDVSLTRPEFKIKHVELSLKYRDNPEIAPIKVPLKADSPAKKTAGKAEKQRFVSDGPYLPFAGNWTAEVRVMDSQDNEAVYSKDFTIYSMQ